MSEFFVQISGNQWNHSMPNFLSDTIPAFETRNFDICRKQPCENIILNIKHIKKDDQHLFLSYQHSNNSNFDMTKTAIKQEDYSWLKNLSHFK